MSAPADPRRDLTHGELRRGDVVRFLPRRGATKFTYVRVTSHIQRRARYSPRAPEWLSFLGVRVRCYDHAVGIGGERIWSVRPAELTRLPRPPARFTSADGNVQDAAPEGIGE